MILANLIAFFLVALLFILGSILWRRLFGRILTQGLPASAALPSLPARRAEATLILLTGLFLIFMMASEHYKGPIVIRNELARLFCIALVVTTLFCCSLIAFSARLAWKGFTSVGVITGAAVIIGYSAFLSYGGPGFDLLKRNTLESTAPFTLRATGVDVDGAEIWANNVYLGKLPYRTTLPQFFATVPFWEKPPADLNTDVLNERVTENGATYTNHRRHWIEFSAPGGGKFKKYYARVKYDGEWAVSTGSSTGSGIGGSSASSTFGIDFPDRRARLNALINRARTAHFAVDPQLLADIIPFRQDAWIALHEERERDPAAQLLLDAIANARYPFESATSPAAAWSLFTKICTDADAAGTYNTFSPAGRAVEILAPRLPADQLLAKALPFLKSVLYANYGYATDTRFHEFHFSTLESDDYQNVTPPAAFPMAQALLVIHKSQLAAGIYPTIIQQQLVPVVLRMNPTGDLNCRIAAFFGGSVAVNYFLRQNWQSTPNALGHLDSMHVGMQGEINRWLFFAAKLNDPAADTFRKEHTDYFLALADQLCPTWDGGIGDNVDFLFNTPEFAARFWPRFSQKMRENPRFRNEALTTQFAYLIRMNADESLFVETYTNTDTATDTFDEPIRAFEKLAAIPDPQHRAAIIAALRNTVRSRLPSPNVVKGFSSAEFARDRLLKALDTAEKGEK